MLMPSGLASDAQAVAIEQRLRGFRQQAEAVDQFPCISSSSSSVVAVRKTFIDHQPLMDVAAIIVGQQGRRSAG